MLISLRNDHKEHLQLLMAQSEQVVADFCKLATDFLKNGPNHKMYNSAASRLSVTPEDIENCIYGIVNLLLLACKSKSSKADFRDSVLTLGFSHEQETVLSAFYSTNNTDIEKLFSRKLIEPHYQDLQWRFEVQVASRSLLHQVTPQITMDLTLKNPETQNSTNFESGITRKLLQTDPTSLKHITSELEVALNECRTPHARKMQRMLSHMQSS